MLLRTTDAGDTWTRVRNGPSSQPIYSMAIDPSTPSTVYAGAQGGVLRSLDSGATWTLTNSGLPTLPIPVVTSLAIDPLAPSTLYAGTNGLGVYRSLNSGASWSALNAGLIHGAVGQLAAGIVGLPTDRTIKVFAGTIGGSVYALTSGTTAGPQPPTGFFTWLVGATA